MEARSALLTFGVCGLVGVSIDIDHIIYYILSYYNPEISLNARFLHIPIILATGCAFLGVGAYFGRLYIRHILRRYKK